MNFMSTGPVSIGLGAATSAEAETAELFAAIALLLGASGSSFAAAIVMNVCRVIHMPMMEITTDFTRGRGCACRFGWAVNLLAGIGRWSS